MICYSQFSFAYLSFLSCKKEQVEKYKEICNENSYCQGIDASNIDQFDLKDFKNKDCIRKKTDSCMCLTFLGFKTHGKFDDFGIYGNFCGWKNAAKDPTGQPIDWKNKFEAMRAMIELDSFDPIDEACKIHDLEYLVSKVSVCEADRILIKKLFYLALDSSNGMSFEKREMALVLAQAMKKNNLTCHFFNLFRK
jgi:hypothetical protein